MVDVVWERNHNVSMAMEWRAERFIQHLGKGEKDFKVIPGGREFQLIWVIRDLYSRLPVRTCGSQAQAF